MNSAPLEAFPSLASSIRGKGHDFDLVSVRIPEEGCVVMPIVLRTDPRRSFSFSAIGEDRLVELVHGITMARIEGNMRAVSRRRGLSIRWSLEAESNRCKPVGHDPLGCFNEPHPEVRHHRIVESFRTRKVVRAKRDMVNHGIRNAPSMPAHIGLACEPRTKLPVPSDEPVLIQSCHERLRRARG